MWEIYSIGDAAFLYQVLQAVAALVGSDELTDLAGIGFAISLLVVGVQGLASGGRNLPVGRAFVAMVLYMAIFGSTQTVAVIDVYSGAVRTVGNLPTGIAAVASSTSRIGYFVTDLFEQAFSTPTMTRQGYGFSLEVIKRVRLNTLTLFNLGPANSPDGASDVYESWVNYIKECTLPGIMKKHLDRNAVFGSPDFMQALRYPGVVERPLLLIPGSYEDCDEAHTLLADYTDGQFVPAFKAQLARILGVADATAVETTIGEALAGLGLTTSVDQFVTTSVLVPIYYAAVAARAEEDFKAAYATSVDDAIRQRNAQWMANQSLFDEYVRPLTTFLEGFVFMTIPFLVFLIPIGAIAMKATSALFLTLVWIQLWMPLLAGVNLYIHSALTGQFAELAAAGQDITSMAGLFAADDLVQRYLAVGGLMASSVPVLSLILIAGFSITSNFFASSLGRQDTFTEAQAAPASFSAFPLRQIEPIETRYAASGYVMATGTPAVLPSYSFSQEGYRSLESAEQTREEASQRFSKSLSSGVSRLWGKDERGTTGALWSDRMNSQTSEAYRLTEGNHGDFIDEWSRQTGMSRDAVVKLGMGIQAGLGVDQILSAGGKLSGDAGQSATDFRGHGKRMAEAWSQRFSDDKSFSNEFTRAIASDISRGHQDAVFANETLRSDESLQRDAADVVSASASFQDVSRNASSVGVRTSLSEDVAVSRIAQDDSARDRLMGYISLHGLGKSLEQYKLSARDELEAHYGDPRSMETAAALRVVAEPQMGNPAEHSFSASRRQEAIAAVLGDGSNQIFAGPGDALRHAGLDDRAPQHGSAREAVEAGDGGALRSEVEEKLGSYRGVGSSGPDRVESAHASAMAQRAERQERHLERLREENNDPERAARSDGVQGEDNSAGRILRDIPALDDLLDNAERRLGGLLGRQEDRANGTEDPQVVPPRSPSSTP